MVAELSRLSPPARRATSRLACLGRAAETSVLAALCGQLEDELHLSLSEAVRAGLVVRDLAGYRETRRELAHAESRQFDALLLDLHMPKLDGFKVIASIRARERRSGGHLWVIAVTARSRTEDRDSCLAAGMDDFVTKPIGRDLLLAALDRRSAPPLEAM